MSRTPATSVSNTCKFHTKIAQTSKQAVDWIKNKQIAPVYCHRWSKFQESVPSCSSRAVNFS